MKSAIYLINLDSSADRLERATQQLQSANLPFTRVSAVDGRILDLDQLPDYDPQAAFAHLGRYLTGGEIGCYLSHLECARRFLQSDADLGVVLEDDFLMQPAMPEVLDQVIAWLGSVPVDWYLINLGPKRLKTHRKLQEFLAGAHRYQISRAHAFPTLTTGLLWSRAGAAAFVADHDKIIAPIDNFLRHWMIAEDKGMAIWPGIVRGKGFGSVIDKTGSNRKKRDRSRFYFFYKQRNMWRDKALALSHRYLGPPKRIA